jgi:DNA-directed RNA polymerase subunit RPC12/RpoP
LLLDWCHQRLDDLKKDALRKKALATDAAAKGAVQDAGARGPSTGAASGLSATKQQPWQEDAPEYLALKEALKLIDERFSMATLSKYLTSTGEMRYMRKGQRCKVHIGDFRRFMQTRQSDPNWAKAFLAYPVAAGKGDVRFFWKCKACGHEEPENAKAEVECPKCGGECGISRKRPPEPKR